MCTVLATNDEFSRSLKEKTHRSDRLEITHTGMPIHHNRLATTVHLRIVEIYIAGFDGQR